MTRVQLAHHLRHTHLRACAHKNKHLRATCGHPPVIQSKIYRVVAGLIYVTFGVTDSRGIIGPMMDILGSFERYWNVESICHEF